MGQLLGRREILQREMQAKQNKGTGTEMKKAGLLFPHQLFRKHPILEVVNAVYLVEEDLFLKQYAFHKKNRVPPSFDKSSRRGSEGTEKIVSLNRLDKVDI